jgi:hypothetical protein
MGMKTGKAALLCVAMTLSGQVPALEPKGFEVTSTAHLLDLCSVSADDPLYSAAMGFCLGYIDAALDYHAALTAGEKYDPITCPATQVTREEVVVVVREWAKGNSQHLHSEAPVVGIMRAASAKWPCSQ